MQKETVETIEENKSSTPESKLKYSLWIGICAVALIVIIALASASANKCEFSSCDEEKEVDSDYCYYHTLYFKLAVNCNFAIKFIYKKYIKVLQKK